MKAFVYSKKTNKKLAIIRGVVKVDYAESGRVRIFTEDDETFTFDTTEVKTTVFINS